MDAVPELAPISEIRKRQNEIFVQLHDNPVILTQRGRAAAVLVSPEQWNRLIARLKDLEQALKEALDVRAVQEIEARISAGEEPILDWADVEAESSKESQSRN
jgi:prevent-host-death family protein